MSEDQGKECGAYFFGQLRWAWVERQTDAFNTTLCERVRVLQQFTPSRGWQDVPEVQL